MFRVELLQIINQSHDSSQDLPDSKTPCYVTSLVIKPNIRPMVPSSWLCILPVHLVWHPWVLKYSMATVLPGNHTWMDGIISQTPFSFFSHHPALLRVSGSGGVQSLSCIQLFATPWTATRQAPLSFTISWSLHRSMSFESVMLSNHLILCCPLLLLPSIFPSIRDFFNESVLRIRWPKYWSFSFSISLSSKYLGLISFRIDWFDLLVVQGTLKSLLQHHSLKASILRCWAFFFFKFYFIFKLYNIVLVLVQLLHPYMTTVIYGGKIDENSSPGSNTTGCLTWNNLLPWSWIPLFFIYKREIMPTAS